jgi:hypothetical protein
MTMVRALAGIPLEKSRRGSRFGTDDMDNHVLNVRDGEVACRQQHENRDDEPDSRRGACVPSVDHRGSKQEAGHNPDRA